MEKKNTTKMNIGSLLRSETVLISDQWNIEEVIITIRTSNISDQITYFYVVDNERRIVGVLPIRRILSAHSEQIVKDVMVKNVITLTPDESVEHAQQLFYTHKYLAFPVVDKDRRFLGVFDITVLTGNSLNLSSSNHRFDDVFETIGVRTSVLRYLTPVMAFRHRFPWLVPTLITGLFCAVLASLFEKTISESIILTFFLTLILGLGESVSIQTLTITIRRLHVERPTWAWYLRSVGRELLTAFFLGVGVAAILIVLIYLWKGALIPGVSIGMSVIFSLCTASFFGMSIPSILHKTKLDPKVAAGPLVLGLSDVFTLLFYFTFASVLL